MSYTLPIAGSAAGWTNFVKLDYDPAGNLKSIDRTQTGVSGPAASLMSASFRNARRPDDRTIITSCAGAAGCAPPTIVRKYAYDPSTGQLNEMDVKSGGTTVAGSHVGYDGVQINDI